MGVMLLRKTVFIVGLAALLGFPGGATAEDVYQQPEEFLAETFSGDVPAPSFLWLKKDMRPDINRILQHDGFRGLRVRYWQDGSRTAWILEEIGKYKPITTGIVVDEGAIERIKVLTYRESHGWEVRHDFFTGQFKGLTLDTDYRLSTGIDGIAGATLSVNALRNLARLALYFHAIATE